MSNLQRPIAKEDPSRQRLVVIKNPQGQVINQYTKERPTIFANKAKGVEIYEDEKEMYHLLLVKKQHDPIKKEYVRHEMVQSFSPVDYRSMNVTKHFQTFDEVEILHDPILNVKGLKTTEPITAENQAPATEVTDAAKELIDLREQYALLFGTPAADGATIAQLKEFIDSKKQQALTDRIAEIKQSLVGISEADLKKEYKATTGKKADDKLSADELVNALAAALATKEETK